MSLDNLTVGPPVELTFLGVGEPVELGPGIPGPQGPAGPPGPTGGAIVHEQSTPAATWTVPHSLNRYPLVQLVVNGQVVLTDLDVTTAQVVATWPQPTAGSMVLA